MKETGISFHKDMIAAIDEDRKDMTRRLIKPQPVKQDEIYVNPYGLTAADIEIDQIIEHCRYGKPGDLLYIKESWFPAAITGNRVLIGYDKNNPDDTNEIITGNVDYYWQKMDKARVISSRFMPKEVARKWLLVKEIRAEPLHDISAGDAIREGIQQIEGLAGTFWKDYSRENAHAFNDPILSFRSLWEKINGKGSGEANPFVFVIEFSKTDNPYKTQLKQIIYGH